MPLIRWRSLRNRIIAWSFVPTAIIMLAVALVTFYAYQKVTEDLVIGRNQEVTRLSAGRLAASLAEYADELTALARTEGIQSNSAAMQRIALTGARNRLVVFDAGAVILDAHGRVVAAEPQRPEIMGQDWSDRPYFTQMIRSNAPVYSDIVQDGPQGAEALVVAVPIIGGQGEFQGTLAGMFRLGAQSVSALYGGIVKLRIGDSGTMYIVDSHGRVVYHSNPDLIGKDLSTDALVQQVLRKSVRDIRTKDLNGQDIVASMAPVPGTPWGLITEESWTTLISSSQGYQSFLLVLLGIGIVAPTLVVTFGVRRITGPIGELIRGAQAVAGGNFGQAITVKTGDELEELAKQFNVMSAELQESYSRLEKMVTDRTRELATLNSITNMVSGSLDLTEILGDAVDQTLQVTDMDLGAAYRLDSDKETLTLMAYRGLSERFTNWARSVPLSKSLAGTACAQGQPVTMRVEDYPEGETKELLTGEGLQFVVSIPLMAKGRILGAMTLSSGTVRELAPQELSLLGAIGQQVGVAMENARLYEQAEQAAAAAERNRLARDLHDAVSQTLFSASLIAEVLPRLWERSPNEGRRRVEELRQLTRGALAEMRTLLVELRPMALTEVPLGDLLKQLAEAVTGRARLPVAFTVESQCELPPDVQVAIYRIAQEALNNVAKHSGASQAILTLRCPPGRVELTVSDNGRGFDPTQVPPDHLGLGIMCERAESIGAVLSIRSQPGAGTEVAAIWHNKDEKEDS